MAPGQYGTNMIPGGMMGMGGNPNQFMTGMGGMGMAPMGGMGMAPMGGMGMAPMGGQYGTNMMGAGMGMGQANPNMSVLNNINFVGPNARGQGPSVESFLKDGFNINGGYNPTQKKEPEQSKEFADLFNMAETKIKDRTHDKPKYEYDYNPNKFGQQQQE